MSAKSASSRQKLFFSLRMKSYQVLCMSFHNFHHTNIVFSYFYSLRDSNIFSCIFAPKIKLKIILTIRLKTNRLLLMRQKQFKQDCEEFLLEILNK